MTPEREAEIRAITKFTAIEKELPLTVRDELLAEIDSLRSELVKEPSAHDYAYLSRRFDVVRGERDHYISCCKSMNETNNILAIEKDQLRAENDKLSTTLVNREAVLGETKEKLAVQEQRLGNAYRMCRELMAEDAYELFREEMEALAKLRGGE